MKEEGFFQKYRNGAALLDNIVVRLVIYYLASMAFFGGLFRLFPQILYYVALERARGGGGKASLDFETGVVVPLGGAPSDLDVE